MIFLSLFYCSYKNSYFSKLVHNSFVLVLMLCSYKDAHKYLTLDLVGTFSFKGLLYFVFSFG